MTDADFERFVLESQEKALRVAYSFLGDWDESRDAAQEAFVRFYGSGSSFRGDASPESWFLRILANHCKDRLRRRKVRAWMCFSRPAEDDGGLDPLEAHPDPGPGPDRVADDRAFRRALAKALAALSQRQRQVFQLKELAGLTFAEVSAALGITEGAAKAHLFRATRTLRDVLLPWRESP